MLCVQINRRGFVLVGHPSRSKQSVHNLISLRSFHFYVTALLCRRILSFEIRPRWFGCAKTKNVMSALTCAEMRLWKKKSRDEMDSVCGLQCDCNGSFSQQQHSLAPKTNQMQPSASGTQAPWIQRTNTKRFSSQRRFSKRPLLFWRAPIVRSVTQISFGHLFLAFSATS